MGAVVLAACAPDPEVRAQDADATRARQGAEAAMTAQLDAVAPAGGLGSDLRDDVCDPGQDNVKVSSTYALRCTFRIVRLVPAEQATIADAVVALRVQLALAGCTGGDALTADAVAATLESTLEGGKTSGLTPMECPEVDMGVGWVTDASRAINGWNSPAVAPPHGFSVSFEPFTASALAEARDHQPVTWWIHTSVTYVEVPR